MAKDCTSIECCNTCKHSRLKCDSPMRTCVVDHDPYANYFGGHSPDYVCKKYEAHEWYLKKQEDNNAVHLQR